MEQYSTGTIKIVIVTNIIPPNEGIAIGTIISDPRPVEVRTGVNARIVVTVVIKQGLILRSAPLIVASLMSLTVWGFLSENIWLR